MLGNMVEQPFLKQTSRVPQGGIAFYPHYNQTRERQESESLWAEKLVVKFGLTKES